MEFDYGLDQRPPFLKLLLFGLQWAAIAVSLIIILGKVAGSQHFSDTSGQIVYLQKMFLVTGVTLFAQVAIGHRLPLICGPAAVLLIGVIACCSFETSTVYSSVMLGGLMIALLGATGLFGYIRKLFTVRVIASVLLLIAFTLTPTILKLIVGQGTGVNPLFHLVFAVCLVFMMFSLHRFLHGIWQSTLIIWSMIIGSMVYLFLFPKATVDGFVFEPYSLPQFLKGLTLTFSIEPGVLISFFFCYLALSINDLGSIRSMDALLKPSDPKGRLSRGITLTGIANIAAGFLGTIGPVNFSLSPGVVASTRCASRYSLYPAAVMIGALAFFPKVIGIIGSVPSVVIGCILLYILTSQVAAGLIVLFEGTDSGPFPFESGLAVGLPVLFGTVVSFLPGPVLDALPIVLRPVLGNGFVTGVVFALVLEHLIFRK